MTQPTILAFDTSGPHCAVAVMLGGRIVAERFETMQRGQAERLMPLIEETMDAVGIVYADLDAIGVGTGPGNFTGIRIGVAAARGLALGLDRPAVGISTFQSLADSVAADGIIAAMVEGPRGQVYVQRFRAGQPLAAPETFAHDAPPAHPFADHLVYLGDPDAGKAMSMEMGEQRIPINAVPRTQRDGFEFIAPRIAQSTAACLAVGQDLPPPSPLYVRRADAAPPKDPAPVLLG